MRPKRVLQIIGLAAAGILLIAECALIPGQTSALTGGRSAPAAAVL